MKEGEITYNFKDAPIGEIYKDLLEFLQNYCPSFLLVTRPTIASYESLQLTLEELAEDLISKEERSEWPGTKLADSTATVYEYRLNPHSIEILKAKTDSLFGWIQPYLPEDLCLIREDKSPMLVTISHEKDVYLIMTAEEAEQLKREMPEIQIVPEKSDH